MKPTQPSASPKPEGAASALRTVIDALTRLGITEDMTTDPSVIRTLLHHYKLHDFAPTSEPMREFLDHATRYPQPLGPLRGAIAHGIALDHPALVTLIAQGNEAAWWCAGPATTTAAHVAYLLEGLTAGMMNDIGFAAEIQAHILKAREPYGLGTQGIFSTLHGVWRATGRVFDAIKTLSVDRSSDDPLPMRPGKRGQGLEPR